MSTIVFDQLPFELLDMIGNLLKDDYDALKMLSCATRNLRAACVPHLFRTLRITFSASGFTRLEEVSNSVFAQYVTAVRYKVPELIDENIPSWDYFRLCVYTPEEFVRDQREQWWNFRGNSLSYASIYKYFSKLSVEQHEILARSRDARTLRRCLPRLWRLQDIQLIFEDTIDQPFRWLATHLFIDRNDSLLLHFETFVEALIGLREHGISIRTFRVHGFDSNIVLEKGFLEKVAHALQTVTNIVLIDSVGLLPCLASIPLPSVLRLELGSCWLQITALETFCSTHKGRLRHIHFEEVWVLADNLDAWGSSLSMHNTATLIEKIVVLRRSGVLRQITVNRRDDGQYEYQEWFEINGTAS
ncbi:hypothetical protein BJX65DRAFT_306178 [Aspergillus insuetus]